MAIKCSSTARVYARAPNDVWHVFARLQQTKGGVGVRAEERTRRMLLPGNSGTLAAMLEFAR